MAKRAPIPHSSRHFLVQAAVAIIVICTLSALLFQKFTVDRETLRVKTELNRIAGQRAYELREALDTLPSQVKLIAEAPITEQLALVDAHSTDMKILRSRLERFFYAYVDNNKNVLQVRLISLKDGGYERVRINRIKSKIEVVSPDNMQFKADRDYYKKSLNLKPGKLYVSEFNLNREYGKIETPYRPVVRISAPIYEAGGQIIAIVVVNFDTRNLFSHAFDSLPAGFVAYINNADDDFIFHPNEKLTYGFDLGKRYRWLDEYSSISRDDEQADHSFGMWENTQLERFLVASHTVEHEGMPTLQLSLALNEDVILSKGREAAYFSLFIVFIILIVIALLVALYSQNVRRRLQVSIGQKRLAAIVSSVGDAIISMAPDGKVLSWNNAAVKMFGYTEDEAIGHLKYELIGTPSIEAERRRLFAQVLKGHNFELNDTVRKHRDGHVIPVSVKASPIRDELDNVVSIVESVRDISLSKAAEQKAHDLNLYLETQVAERTEELEVALARANAASQAKSDFVANISHEIRTPMNAVLGITRLLANTALSLTQRKYLGMLRGSGEALLSLINDILDFSKIEAKQLRLDSSPFRLGDILNTLSAIMSTLAGNKNIELVINVEPDLPRSFNGDAMRLQQVLVNLISNAIKFTETGEVVLSINKVAAHGDELTVEFHVRDTGIGMTAAQQAQIFAPFFQADTSISRRFGGTGLGLAISRNIVGLMGGAITLLSQLDRGSEFIATVQLQALPDPKRSKGILEELHLLVVDDNESSRACLVRIIKSWHWTADIASSGLDALARLQDMSQSERCYDAILIDCDMPGMSGVETLKAMSDFHPAVKAPIVMMGGVSDQLLLSGMIDRDEVNAMILKPVTGSELFDTLVEALNMRPELQTRQPAVDSLIAGKHFLLVEDNLTNQLVAKGLLEQAGAQVTIKENGKEAIDELSENPHRYSLVLMDVQMPILDGLSATRVLRNEMGFTLPILAMSAGVMDDERSRCIEAGMNDFIIKPIDVGQMLSTIKAYIQHAPESSSEAIALSDSMERVSEKEPLFTIETLYDMGGDERFLTMISGLVSKLVAAGTTPLDEVEGAWHEGNVDAAMGKLHTLRGSLGSLGAKRFASLTLLAEECIQRGASPEVLTVFGELRAVLQATIVVANEWLDRHST